MIIEAAPPPHLPTRRDRNVIHVDFSQERSGVAAALRQAYSKAASEPSEHDFERILNDLR